MRITACDNFSSEVSLCNLPNLLRNFFWRENKIDAPAIYRALRHIWLDSRFQLLGNRNASYLFDATQRCSTIAVKP